VDVERRGARLLGCVLPPRFACEQRQVLRQARRTDLCVCFEPSIQRLPCGAEQIADAPGERAWRERVAQRTQIRPRAGQLTWRGGYDRGSPCAIRFDRLERIHRRLAWCAAQARGAQLGLEVVERGGERASRISFGGDGRLGV